MSQLTKEYFDKQVEQLATKQALEEQTKELKVYTDEQTEALAQIVHKAFSELERELDVRKDVEALKLEMKDIRQALKLD